MNIKKFYIKKIGKMKDLYNFEHRWSCELLDWIDETKLNFGALSSNPSAICYLEKNPDKIVWNMLSLNPLAIHLLEQNPDKICWNLLSKNPNAIHLLEKNRGRIVFLSLSHNTNPKIMSLIQEYLDDNQNFGKKIFGKCIDYIDWNYLSSNPSAIHLLENTLKKYPKKINWSYLSENPSAIHMLEQNPDKINWKFLSKNPSAIHLLEQNKDKIDWNWLSSNPSAIHLLEKNLDKICWTSLTSNPSAIYLLEKNKDKIFLNFLGYNTEIFKLDYEFLRSRMNIIRKELMEKTWHPSRFEEWCVPYIKE